jgi:signal transduction histidine kinase
MFWKLVPLMFLASAAFGAFTIVKATLEEEIRLRKALTPHGLSQMAGRALKEAMPLGAVSEAPEAWCADALGVLADRIFGRILADRGGDDNVNSFNRSVRSGRLAASLSVAGATRCTFPKQATLPLPALAQAMDSQTSIAADASLAGIREQADGWISVASIAPEGPGGPVLTVGVYLLSPFDKLAQRGSILGALATFILYTNIITALVLVFVVIWRIQRADQVLAAWTVGNLSARFNDSGKDEFSRLTQKLDVMADSLSGVIDVRQALAASEERNRLARDLHDTAKQRAFALNLQLSAARKRLAPDTQESRLIEAALALASQLQQDLAAVIHPLLEPTMAESGFRQVLLDGVERMLEGSGVGWSFTLDPVDEALLASRQEVARALLLMTVEAVANVLKHAQATQCSISGRREGRLFAWRIDDDGRGMRLLDTRKVKGVGLASMKLRATRLRDGVFEILPGINGGTSIKISFRLEE